jgi:hypothetical protein
MCATAMRAKRRGALERPAALWTDELRTSGHRLRSAPLASWTFRGCLLSFRRSHQFLSTGGQRNYSMHDTQFVLDDNAPLAPASATCLFALFSIERANHCSSVNWRPTSQQINVESPLEEPQHRVRFLVEVARWNDKVRNWSAALLEPGGWSDGGGESSAVDCGSAGVSSLPLTKRRQSTKPPGSPPTGPRLGSRPYLHDQTAGRPAVPVMRQRCTALVVV